jgi:glutamine phosphoribosylpyrophosphate amidotransferase
MCGLAGLVAKTPELPVAQRLSAMLNALRDRGPDSSGLALYKAPRNDGFANLRLFTSGTTDAAHADVASGVQALLSDAGIEVSSSTWRENYLDVVARLPLDSPDDLGKLASAVEDGFPTLKVFSIGESLDLVKGVDSALGLHETFGLGANDYTHAIGHVRLATESRIDVAHSHPFWARPFPDVALVHNGHITNYHKLRRIYEQRGYRFQTGNDSEFVSVYLAGALHDGLSLDEAVDRSVTDLDGSFTYLVSSPAGVAVARDKFGAKPCLIAETDEFVAIASEEGALYAAFGDDKNMQINELGAGETRTWHI